MAITINNALTRFISTFEEIFKKKSFIEKLTASFPSKNPESVRALSQIDVMDETHKVQNDYKILRVLLNDARLSVYIPKFLTLTSNKCAHFFEMFLVIYMTTEKRQKCITVLQGLIKTGYDCSEFFRSFRGASIYSLFSDLLKSGVSLTDLTNAGFDLNHQEGDIPLLSHYITDIHFHRRQAFDLYKEGKSVIENKEEVIQKYGFFPVAIKRPSRKAQMEDLKNVLPKLDINARAKDGKTPLDFAMTHRKHRVISLLNKHGAKTGDEILAEGAEKHSGKQRKVRRTKSAPA